MDNMNPTGIGMQFPKFSPMHFRDYQNYLPTAYDNSLSMQESLLQVLNFCNEIGLLNQHMSDNWNMLLGWIKTNGIDDSVTAKLNEWVTDGTMAKVLDKTVLNDINQKMEELLSDYPKQLQDAKDYFDNTATAFKSDVNNTLSGQSNKIQQNYDSLMQQLSSISTGVKGAYNNLAALNSSKPNGDTGMYVTTDTGDWFFWNGTAWQDGGKFQASGLDDASLNKFKKEVLDASGQQVLNQTNAMRTSLYQQQAELNDHSDVLNQVNNTNNAQQLELDTHDSELKLNRTDVQDVQGVGSLKNIELVDENGNRLVDNNGVGISGQRWLVDTDKTLSQADLPADAKAVGEALITKPDAYDIPILYLNGADIPSLKTKTDSLSAGISYSFPRFNISGNLKKIKVQGSSSANLAKKNYTLQFDQSIEIFPEYGKQNKYVIKANMTDFSHVRNTGSAKLWGGIRETRIKADDAIKINDSDYLVDNSGNHVVGESDPQLSIGGTYGAIDGFPIAVYINNQYWGMYSFNVPKDAWMAKMPNKPNHAIVSASWTRLNTPILLVGTDMEIEFCGTEETGWVLNSINALVNALITHYTLAADFDNAINNLLDINSAIDYYVYTAAIGNVDGVLRNFLLQTWDSKKWYMAAYDLDMTFGLTPDLSYWLSPVYNSDNIRRGGATLTNLGNDDPSFGNRLFYQLWKFHKEDIIARYKELVSGPLSSGAVSTLLTNFAVHIPDALLDQEDKTWPQTSFSGTNNLSQIRWWYMEHTNFLTNSIANA